MPTRPQSILPVLNRLLVAHGRSLSIYLSDARPWTHRGEEQAAAVLYQIAADHKSMVDRLGAMILDHDGIVAQGEFPMEFTDSHDLSLDYLLTLIIENQKQLIQTIAPCIPSLFSDQMAESLVQESLGMAKGHLESLEEVVQGIAASQ